MRNILNYSIKASQALKADNHRHTVATGKFNTLIADTVHRKNAVVQHINRTF